MKIGVVGPIWYNIPPRKYGGTERVVANLVNELCKRHKVYLFGPKTAVVDSRVNIIPTSNTALREGKKVDWKNLSRPILHIAKAFDNAHNFDILHMHLNTIGDFMALPLASFSKTPVLFTMHFTLEEKHSSQQRELLLAYSYMPYTSISNSQRKDLPTLNFIDTVYNGLDIDEYRFSKEAQDYFVWVGRMAPWKGAREAIKAAKKAKVKLVLGGHYDPSIPLSYQYFTEQIEPLLDDKQIVWKHNLKYKDILKIVRGAKGFLNPIRWEEPFGLVMAESQLLGTPVISYRRGSAPEVIEDGKSGFLVEGLSGMISKIGKVGNLDRVNVRANGEKFNSDRMARGYEKAYEKTIKNWKKYLSNAPKVEI